MAHVPKPTVQKKNRTLNWMLFSMKVKMERKKQLCTFNHYLFIVCHAHMQKMAHCNITLFFWIFTKKYNWNIDENIHFHISGFYVPQHINSHFMPYHFGHNLYSSGLDANCAKQNTPAVVNVTLVSSWLWNKIYPTIMYHVILPNEKRKKR